MKKSSLFSMQLLYLIILVQTLSLDAAEQSISWTTKFMQPKVLIPVGIIGLAYSATVITRWICSDKKLKEINHKLATVQNELDQLKQRNRAREERLSSIQAALQQSEDSRTNPAQEAHQERCVTKSVPTQTSKLRRQSACISAFGDKGELPECLRPLAYKRHTIKLMQQKKEQRQIRKQRQYLNKLLQTTQHEMRIIPEDERQSARILRDTLIFKGLRHAALLGIFESYPDNPGARELQEKAINDIMATLEQAGIQRTMMAAQLLLDHDLTPLHKLVTKYATESEQLDRTITITQFLVNDITPSRNNDSDDEDDEDADDESDDDDSDNESSLDGFVTSNEQEQD